MGSGGALEKKTRALADLEKGAKARGKVTGKGHSSKKRSVVDRTGAWNKMPKAD